MSEVLPRPPRYNNPLGNEERTEQNREINPLLPSGSLTSDQLGAKTPAGGQIRLYNCLFPGTEQNFLARGKLGSIVNKGKTLGLIAGTGGGGCPQKQKKAKLKTKAVGLCLPVEDMMKSK